MPVSKWLVIVPIAKAQRREAGMSHSVSEFGVRVSSLVQFLTVFCFKQSIIYLRIASDIA